MNKHPKRQFEAIIMAISTKSASKVKHDKFQRDLKIFSASKSNSALDLIVFRNVAEGENSIEKISAKLKIKVSVIVNAISSSVFKVNGDSIHIA